MAVQKNDSHKTREKGEKEMLIPTRKFNPKFEIKK